MGEEKDVEPNTNITDAAHFKVTMSCKLTTNRADISLCEFTTKNRVARIKQEKWE